VFVPPGESAPYAHRITSVTRRDGRVVVTTKGDANPVADSWQAALSQATVPKVVAAVPAIGRPLTWVHTRALHAAAVAALGLLLTVVGTGAILRAPSRREVMT
jgi:hypothetical protein